VTLADGSVPILFKTPLIGAGMFQLLSRKLTEHANKAAISLTWKE
jgi:hypothetical protein